MRLLAGNCNPALQQNVGFGGPAGAIIPPMFHDGEILGKQSWSLAFNPTA
jgi:hypothetical protein